MKSIKVFSSIVLLAFAKLLVSMDEKVTRITPQTGGVEYRQAYINKDGFYEGESICIKHKTGEITCTVETGSAQKARELQKKLFGQLELLYEAQQQQARAVQSASAGSFSSASSTATALLHHARQAARGQAKEAARLGFTLVPPPDMLGILGITSHPEKQKLEKKTK